MSKKNKDKLKVLKKGGNLKTSNHRFDPEVLTARTRLHKGKGTVKVVPEGGSLQQTAGFKSVNYQGFQFRKCVATNRKPSKNTNFWIGVKKKNQIYCQ